MLVPLLIMTVWLGRLGADLWLVLSIIAICVRHMEIKWLKWK